VKRSFNLYQQTISSDLKQSVPQSSNGFMAMKVLTFTTLYPNNVWPNNGVFIQERMTNFAKLNGCEVKVVAPIPYFPSIKLGSRWKYSQVTKQELREGLEVYHPRYFMTPKVGMSFYGLKMFLSVLPAVKKIKRDFSFDIIDAHYAYPDGFAAVLLGKYLKKPVVVSARGSDIHLYSRLPIIQRLLRFTLQNSARIISVCSALKNVIIRLGIPEENISVIGNGVDVEKFFSVPREEARKKMKLPDKLVILSIGHLTPNKGFDLLIKAVRNLYAEANGKDLYLAIVGEGRYRKELERLISSLGLNEYVRLAGEAPHKDLHNWYSVADIFCLVSEDEGWPNVVLESLACGTPVVATPVGGIPEIIRSDGIGLLTKRNEQDIAKTISIALKKEWNPNEIIQYAREHTWHKVALSIHDAFQSVLNSKHNNPITQ